MTHAGDDPLFECRALEAGYGNTRVVHGFDLAANAGTVVAVLGPNGAGKTTLLLTLAGLLPRLAGEVCLNGVPMLSGHPGQANRAGVVLVPDDRSLFSTLTVRENLMLAAGKNTSQPQRMLDLFGALQNRRKVVAGALSGGEQQMLAIARALVQEPKVLLIDEMSMGLAPSIVEDLLPRVRNIAGETGAVVIMVEQHVNLALEVANDAIIMVHGECVLRGSASELAKDPAALEAAYLGRLTETVKSSLASVEGAASANGNAPR